MRVKIVEERIYLPSETFFKCVGFVILLLILWAYAEWASSPSTAVDEELRKIQQGSSTQTQSRR
jgi:hypothetical protein